MAPLPPSAPTSALATATKPLFIPEPERMPTTPPEESSPIPRPPFKAISPPDSKPSPPSKRNLPPEPVLAIPVDSSTSEPVPMDDSPDDIDTAPPRPVSALPP